MEPSKPSLRVFVEVAERQAKLMVSIVEALKDISLIKSRLRLKRVKDIEKRITSIREELVNQEMFFEEPRKYLKSYQDIGAKARSQEEAAGDEYTALQFLLNGQLPARRIRIFSLFEHLQSEMTYKKAEIQFNKTMALSLIAIFIAVASLVINNLDSIINAFC